MKKKDVRAKVTEMAKDRVDLVAAALNCGKSVAIDALLRAGSLNESIERASRVVSEDAAAIMAWRRGGSEDTRL